MDMVGEEMFCCFPQMILSSWSLLWGISCPTLCFKVLQSIQVVHSCSWWFVIFFRMFSTGVMCLQSLCGTQSNSTVDMLMNMGYYSRLYFFIVLVYCLLCS